MAVTHKSNSLAAITIPYTPATDNYIEVKVWNDSCRAKVVDYTVNEAFSDILKKNVQLVMMPEETRRQVDPKYARSGQITAFSDGYPLLMISEESLADLNSRLPESIEMRRFRPNLVIAGGHAYCEDQLGHWQIGDVSFKAVKPCSRCVVTTINPDTGAKSSEPLTTLSKYRKQDGKVMFGMNLIHQLEGSVLQVGDDVTHKDK